MLDEERPLSVVGWGSKISENLAAFPHVGCISMCWVLAGVNPGPPPPWYSHERLMNLAILPPSPELNPAGGGTYLGTALGGHTFFLSMESVRQASRPLPAPRLHPRVIFFGPGRWPWPCCFWRPARPERFTEVSWTLGSYRRLRLLPLGPVCPEAPHRAGFACGSRPCREAAAGANRAALLAG